MYVQYEGIELRTSVYIVSQSPLAGQQETADASERSLSMTQTDMQTLDELWRWFVENHTERTIQLAFAFRFSKLDILRNGAFSIRRIMYMMYRGLNIQTW